MSRGDFTKGARYEAERATIPLTLTLMDVDDLVKALLERDEKMHIETQRLIPPAQGVLAGLMHRLVRPADRVAMDWPTKVVTAKERSNRQEPRTYMFNITHRTRPCC